MKARTAEEVPPGRIFLSPGMDLAKSDSVKELQKQSRRAKRRSMHKCTNRVQAGASPQMWPPASPRTLRGAGPGTRSPSPPIPC